MTSRAPPGASAAAAASGSSWAYPGTGGVGGMDVAGGQNGPGGLRYASEETVAELTKEEKVSVRVALVGARRLTEMLIPFRRALYVLFGLF